MFFPPVSWGSEGTKKHDEVQKEGQGRSINTYVGIGGKSRECTKWDMKYRTHIERGLGEDTTTNSWQETGDNNYRLILYNII